MIVTGSQAAKMRGYLPPWREGGTDDIDIFGTEAELAAFREAVDPCFGICIPTEHVRGHHMLIYATGLKTRVKVEFNTRARPSLALMEALPDNEEVSLMGLPAKAISAQALYAVKRAYKRKPIWREKNDKDIAYWRSLNMKMLPEHIELFRTLWYEFEYPS